MRTCAVASIDASSRSTRRVRNYARVSGCGTRASWVCCDAVKIELDQLKALFQLLGEEDVHEFEHESDGVRIKVVRQGHHVAAAAYAAASAPPAYTATLQPASIPAAPPSVAANETIVTSPFVGTFYRAASPDTPAFADVGSVVQPGQTLCIVEAMKLMNEIEAEHAGTVVECYAQNGKAVEFGQRLFRIKRA